MGGPRLLAIMGSGETAPTMARIHRMLVDRLDPPVRAVLLDTPYGFQVNAEQVSQRAVAYFGRSLGIPLRVASWRSTGDDVLSRERALALVREASYVFAGPGSPTHALRVWRGWPLREVLADKLAAGGCVTFASAAALTLGVATVPVYEVYKVGAPPAWEPGLDLLSGLGLQAAVIPHYDNAEGGSYDTRFCYLGEQRLRAMESMLDGGTFVLGVDEHTACMFDLDAGTASVLGRGVVTVRRSGASTTYPSGCVVPLDVLRSGFGAAAVASGGGPPPAAQPSLRAAAAALVLEFDRALPAGDVDAAVRATLGLEQVIVDWSADTEELDTADGPRAELRRMIVRLGELATAGARDARELLAPFVDALVELRDQARAERSWPAADAVRTRLTAAGVELRDTPTGTVWSLR